jgi:hypothetical protein
VGGAVSGLRGRNLVNTFQKDVCGIHEAARTAVGPKGCPQSKSVQECLLTGAWVSLNCSALHFALVVIGRLSLTSEQLDIAARM